MSVVLPENLGNAINSAKGLCCWYVSTGGAAKSTFELAIGSKVPRVISLKNTAHSEEFRRFGSEISIFVWCAWRLDGPKEPVTSWDDKDASIESGLNQLIGANIDLIQISLPAWDANIAFSNSLCLRLFCDHVPSDPSYDGNWNLTTGSERYNFGPGAKYSIEPTT
jgi:hypothetical protein